MYAPLPLLCQKLEVLVARVNLVNKGLQDHQVLRDKGEKKISARNAPLVERALRVIEEALVQMELREIQEQMDLKVHEGLLVK